MGSVLPKGVHWIRDSAVKFDPDNKRVHTGSGDQISYEYMVIAMGVALDFHQVPGLEEALEKDPMVCSNYSPKYVSKTSKAIHAFKEGNAIFTFPNTPVKCAGAPQQVAYLTDWHFRREGKRERAEVIYNTSLPVVFSVKKYAASLMNVIKERGIKLNVRRNLVEVRADKKEAVFENLDNPSEKITYQIMTMFDIAHLAPS
ncbi:unnamed protein product [Darwinula stevensoni]|uniref:Sulfide:quinone oxidoreductase, mitochondrial n=1 Tax=Darwinula stevensoni TaxID=69355 RepID=A0A7R9AHV4_9CRUS|nr:unnamed protein product [Darwinula stevensoni]CAG0904828.1 unnamed protein product [Darwinula stevensoni]